MVGDDVIRVSFAKVKSDFAEHDKRISELKHELDELRKKVVDYMPRLLEQNNQILKRLEVLEQSVVKRQDPLKEQLLSKYKRSRREVVKQKLLEYIREKEPSLAQLRDVMVHEQGYCSRATFYRYLEELQTEKAIELVSINGVQRVALLSQTVSH